MKYDKISEEELTLIREHYEKTTTWISYVDGRDHISGSNFIMTGETI